MRNPYLKFSLILILAIIAFFISCKEEDPLVITGNIEGTIVHAETNQPINSVNVLITANSNTSFVEQSKLTGSDGKFSFKDIEAGSYKLNFLKEGFEVNHKNITITAGQTSSGDIALQTIKPVLNVSVTQLDFGASTNSLPVQITNSGKGTLQWTIVNNLPWLTINPTSGNITTESVAVTVTVDRSGLASGPLTGSFIVNSNGGSSTVNITLTIPGPALGVSPMSLDFGNVEAEKNLQVSNSGGVGSITYQATTAQSWISLTNSNGSTSNEIKIVGVSVNRAGLATGNYSGSIVINSGSNSVTVPVSMAVIQPTMPDVLNGSVSGITYNTAEVSANLISMGSNAVTQHGHCWSASPNPTISNNKTQLGGTNSTGAYTSNLSGLNHSTNYYVKAYATNSVGTKYSDQIIFTSLAPPTLATVQTINAEDITHDQAKVYGNLTALGDGLVIDYGFCYTSTNALPTTSDFKLSLGSTTQTGLFNGLITGLIQFTKYYVRAYAVNSVGTTYGNIIEVTTVQAPPIVTNGLLAYYTFDNQNANDYKESHHGISQYIIFTQDVPGSGGYSASFNGTNSFINVPNVIFKNNIQTISFNVWIKSNSTIIDLFAQRTSDSFICIDNNGFLRVAYTIFDMPVTNNLLNNQWHMLTITRTQNNYSYYIDGVLHETKSGGSGWQGSDCKIGTNAYATGWFFKGKLDNIRFYSRTLNQQEIQQIYNSKQ